MLRQVGFARQRTRQRPRRSGRGRRVVRDADRPVLPRRSQRPAIPNSSCCERSRPAGSTTLTTRPRGRRHHDDDQRVGQWLGRWRRRPRTGADVDPRCRRRSCRADARLRGRAGSAVLGGPFSCPSSRHRARGHEQAPFTRALRTLVAARTYRSVGSEGTGGVRRPSSAVRRIGAM